MNDNFLEIISATSGERRDCFLSAAARLGTTEQNIEKDFWCAGFWMRSFTGASRRSTPPVQGRNVAVQSLRIDLTLSEDIDITVFREDLGQAATVAQLEALSRVAICGKIAGPQPGLAGPPQPAVKRHASKVVAICVAAIPLFTRCPIAKVARESQAPADQSPRQKVPNVRSIFSSIPKRHLRNTISSSSGQA